MSPLRAIRRATAADAGELARIINLAYVVEESFVAGPRTSSAEVERLCGRGRFLVLEEDREPVGCVYLELSGERAYLGLLAVLPERQGGGRGRALVEAVEATGRAEGARAVDLRVVDLREELHGFYQRLGYRAVGSAPFPDGERVKRPVAFVIYEKAL
jgi:N-acetylglutamate synthase-like GNAT family acetyltransferase